MAATLKDAVKYWLDAVRYPFNLAVASGVSIGKG